MDVQTNGRNHRKTGLANRFTHVLFIIYLIALFWILVFKLGVQFSYMGSRNVNMLPFRETILYGIVDTGQIVSNVIIFVPLGIYTGIIFPTWGFGKNLLFFLSISVMVEALQFILAVGALDITDMITNTSGGIVGWIICKAIEKAFNNRDRAQKFINIVAALGTGVVLLLLLLLKMDMLPVRYQ